MNNVKRLRQICLSLVGNVIYVHVFFWKFKNFLLLNTFSKSTVGVFLHLLVSETLHQAIRRTDVADMNHPSPFRQEVEQRFGLPAISPRTAYCHFQREPLWSRCWSNERIDGFIWLVRYETCSFIRSAAIILIGSSRLTIEEINFCKLIRKHCCGCVSIAFPTWIIVRNSNTFHKQFSLFFLAVELSQQSNHWNMIRNLPWTDARSKAQLCTEHLITSFRDEIRKARKPKWFFL